MKMFIKIVSGLWIIFCLCSCAKENSRFAFFEINEVSIYEYGEKNSFSKYSKYESFLKMDEIKFDTFTVILVNEKIEPMPEKLYNSILKFISDENEEKNKIIYISGNPDKIFYEDLRLMYNWDDFGNVIKKLNRNITSVDLPSDSKKSKESIFYERCELFIHDIVYNYVKQL